MRLRRGASSGRRRVGVALVAALTASAALALAAPAATAAPPAAAPAITSVPSATFTVGSPGSFIVTATGTPTPTVVESGFLPSGIAFDPATNTLSGTPPEYELGSFDITFTASNGVGSPDVQAFTVTVNEARLTYPIAGQTNVDTTQAFTWSTIAQAQGYILIAGTSESSSNLVNSGVLPPATASFAMPPMPAGVDLWATLITEINGSWTSYDAINFWAKSSGGTLIDPSGESAAANDPTLPFTWSTIASAQGYIVVVGTTPYGSNLANSGVLPATQTSYQPPILPAGEDLYATLVTKVNGSWDRSDLVDFLTRKPIAMFSFPVDGQQAVVTPNTFTWSTIAGAERYDLVIGTTAFGANLVNSGLLAPTQSTFSVPQLPANKVLYATLLTEVAGTWHYEAVTFTTV